MTATTYISGVLLVATTALAERGAATPAVRARQLQGFSDLLDGMNVTDLLDAASEGFNDLLDGKNVTDLLDAVGEGFGDLLGGMGIADLLDSGKNLTDVSGAMADADDACPDEAEAMNGCGLEIATAISCGGCVGKPVAGLTAEGACDAAKSGTFCADFDGCVEGHCPETCRDQARALAACAFA
eukprot:CAMPEP_0172530472 /NCGR_PEP_ID=MMETSP1067-20121228/4195_1 /TAXON_ID=265564 ORGANISM="Thalassiosira punctigera, Strain Tpunct2005C2" /NCGR_SAMPLE_ID=MMETSP1067 /ASSEMBLY_ACC=CAM_ASM_000444 /LENGTH=183 /DNA_ID=CAMNT_0013314689 /DNA_START=70 /DNA_END=617 /DNA_ORIENTATION=+